jgi:predicted SAM-dependent methyltransferase
MTLVEKFITGISYLLHPEKRKLIKIAGKFKSKIGLEIGGPSSFFSIRSYFPIYLYAERIDGVNFSNNTVWEGTIVKGQNFLYYNGKKGYQYIDEASCLSEIDNNKYDFILSCHCLEHTANSLKTLKEWNRVLKNDGYFILVLPDKHYTFDEYRPITTFDHLKDDLQKGTDEKDETHFEEVINLHNLNKDTGIITKQELIERTYNNYSNRCVHHHVFSFELIKEMLEYTGFSTYLQQWVAPFHLVTIAKKTVNP